MLQEEDPTKYEAHFAKYIEAGIDADKMEEPLKWLAKRPVKGLSRPVKGWKLAFSMAFSYSLSYN